MAHGERGVLGGHAVWPVDVESGHVNDFATRQCLPMVVHRATRVKELKTNIVDYKSALNQVSQYWL